MENSPGIESVLSPFPVEVTVSRFKTILASKGLNLFADIDHRAGAAQVGLQMRPAHVLIFGNAKAGTPLMVERPLLALDLPLKILIWEDADHQTWVSYNSPEYLVERHSLPADLAKNISGVAGLISLLISHS